MKTYVHMKIYIRTILTALHIAPNLYCLLGRNNTEEALRHKAAWMKVKGLLLSEKVHWKDSTMTLLIRIYNNTTTLPFSINLYNKLWLSNSGDESNYQRLRHFSYDCSQTAMITQPVYLSKLTKLCL